MTASRHQPAVLDPPPPFARVLTFDLRSGADARPALDRLRDWFAPERTVLGVGLPLVVSLGKSVPGLRAFPALVGPGASFPSTQGAVWAMLASGDGDLQDRATGLSAALGDAFVLREEVATFRHREGRDLSGYVDGTANPVEDLAVKAAILSNRGAGLDGGTFCAVQKYVHDLRRFSGLTGDARDHVIGRSLATNDELPDAPPTAHVKRAEQEAYDPPAFMVRRSMPWGGVDENGLYFVAYGESLDRFERVLRRMAGVEDGVVDGLLAFTRAVTGSYYFCPPLRDGKLDWSTLR